MYPRLTSNLLFEAGLKILTFFCLYLRTAGIISMKEHFWHAFIKITKQYSIVLTVFLLSLIFETGFHVANGSVILLPQPAEG